MLQRIFSRVYGKPCWNVGRGYGSSITFDFGKPRLDVQKQILKPSKKNGIKYPKRMAYVYGEWHLWIDCCHWQIRREGRLICNSESNSNRIDQACVFLNGQILTEAIVQPETSRADFHFDLGGHLRTMPYEGEPLEMWSLRCPNDWFYQLRADQKYAYCAGDTPPQKVAWLPFN